MSASDLHESMINPAVRGQYLAAIRNRGKDVLINDVTEAMDLLISMSARLEAAEKRIAELESNARISQQARDGLLERAITAENELVRRDALEPVSLKIDLSGISEEAIKKVISSARQASGVICEPAAAVALPNELDNESGFVDLYRNGYNKAIADIAMRLDSAGIKWRAEE